MNKKEQDQCKYSTKSLRRSITGKSQNSATLKLDVQEFNPRNKREEVVKDAAKELTCRGFCYLEEVRFKMKGWRETLKLM